MFGTNGVKTLTKTADENVLNAWVAGDRNHDPDKDTLTNLHEYDGGAEPTDPWNKYTMYNWMKAKGLLRAEYLTAIGEFTDAEARRFGITEGDFDSDGDNDLISNLNEMQAYYMDKTALKDLCVTNAWSDGTTPDYFRVCGSSYLGLLFNGGEFIAPDMRKALGIATEVNAGTRDYQNSGWDNWSVVQYSLKQQDDTDYTGVSAELALIVRYINAVLPGEFVASNITVKTVREFVNGTWSVKTVTTDDMIDYFGGRETMLKQIAENKQALGSDDIEIPDTKVNLVLKYAGNDAKSVFVEAYQVNSAYPEYGEQLSAQWSAQAEFDAGVAKVTLETPSSGSLKQGAARFVAYIDVDGDGQFSAADTYGTAETTVGYRGADVTIRMGDANTAAYPVFRNSISNDCNVIALVRSQVNGHPLWGGKSGSARVVWYTKISNNEDAFTPWPAEWRGKFENADYIGLDAALAEAAKSLLATNEIDDVASVTYEVLYLHNGKEAINVRATDLNNYMVVSNGQFVTYNQSVNEEFTVYYSLTRDVPDALAVAGGTEDDFTVSFKVPANGKANTKFFLEVGGTVYPTDGLGYPLVTAADGLVVLDADWFEANGIEMKSGDKEIRVALGNDKYPDKPTKDSEWSGTAKFYLGAGANRNGKLAITVKHPTATFAKGITIAVYEQADLAQPVKYVTDKATDTAIELTGLKAGAKYYVAAWYVRNDGDGRTDASERKPYDTWGYVTMLGESENGFDAKAVAATEVTTVTNTVYLQDTDWNDNGTIDRDETLSATNGVVVRALSGTYVDNVTKDPDDIEDDEEEESVSSDVMAYASVPFTCIAIEVPDEKDPTKVNVVWYALTEAQTGTNVTANGVAVGTPITDLTGVASTYMYRSSRGLGTNVTFAADCDYKVVDVQTKNLALVHAQVLDYYGYDYRTANGGVASGERLHTKDITDSDKKNVTNYLANVLGVTSDNWSDFTLTKDYADADPVEGGIGDGIMDGWELYTMFAPDGVNDGLLTSGGATLQITEDDLDDASTKVLLSPWYYEDRNADADGDGLSNLLEYDGGYYPTAPYLKDTNNDGIMDNYAQLYHLKGDDAGADADGDGLSNYAEYLISEVFQYTKLDPDDPMTDGSCVDYFRKMGELYLGEIFTDHDQVDDLWEESFADAAADGAAYANRYIYDPSRDADGDGWSNFAEAAAGTNPEQISTVGIDGYTYAEHPVPMIEARVTYTGKRNGITSSLIFKAWNEKSDAGMTQNPDAIWTVAASTSSSESESSESETSDQKSRSRYIGKNPCTKRVFTLGPGAVSPGSVRVYFRDQGWRYAAVKDGVELASYQGDSAAAKWYALVQDVNGDLITSITNETTAVKVGTVDYTTGRITLDLSAAALTRSVYASVVNATANSVNDATDSNIISKYSNCEKLNLADSYVKVEWISTTVGTSVDGVYYLGDADAVTSAKPARGYVREGATRFVVFADIDGNGEYTAGEPFGFVKGVDVGWQSAKFDIELTDTSPVFARIFLTDSEKNNDRTVWSSMSDTVNVMSNGVSMAESDGNVRVRVVRTAVNGVKMTEMKNPSNKSETAPQRVVMDKVMNLGIRAYLHEGDFCDNEFFDVDSYLAGDVTKYRTWGFPDDVTNVTYRLIFGNGVIQGDSVTNLPTFVYSVDRRFDTKYVGINPSLGKYEEVVTYNTRPTFRWCVNYGGVNCNSYTAFKIEIFDEDETTVIYDSGVHPTPRHETENGIDYYVWTAPSVVDNLLKPGVKISRNGIYKWKVTVYNARYQDGSKTHKYAGTLKTAVNVTQDVNDHACSAIPFCVKYTGPANVLAKAADETTLLGKVRVQAFTSADFSGEPVSEAVPVTNNFAEVTDLLANGKVCGLPVNDQYYLRAYIDMNGNCQLDDWESRGTVYVGGARSVASVAPTAGMSPVSIWIEDADTDDDWLPDAYEFAKAGWEDVNSWQAQLGTEISGKFVITSELANQINNTTLSAGISSGMSGAPLTVFTYNEVAGLICGSTENWVDSVDVIRRAVEKKIKPDTLTIKSITLDPDGQKVVLGVNADVTQSIAGRQLALIYKIDGTTATATVKVYKKASLVSAEWTLVKNGTEDGWKVDLGDSLEAQIEVDVSSADIDFSSGYFKVVVEQK